MTQADKWDRIYSQKDCMEEPACEVLSQNVHLLPSTGKALDLASGLGANAILLAQNNLQTHAWDISQIALEKLEEFASSHHLNICTSLKDVENHPPDKNTFDVICVSNFLHRQSFHNLIEALTNNGLLFYQTFVVEKTMDIGPSNPSFLLKKNELLNLCHGMEILVYREEGIQGNIESGWRNQAMVVARKD